MVFLSLVLALNLSCVTNINPKDLIVEIKVPNEPFFAGEIVYLESRLKNISDHPVTISFSCNDVLSCNYGFRVYDEKGNYIDCYPSLSIHERAHTLAPGENYINRLPFYLCTDRDLKEDIRYRVKAVYGWKEGDLKNVIESEEKWLDVLAPKTDVDKAAYRLLYSLWLNPEKKIPNAYSAGLSGYTLIPVKYPTSIYTKYALFVHGKDCVELDTQEYIRQGIALLSRVFNDYPAFNLTNEVLYYLGLAHQKLSEKEKAIEFYNKAIKEYPDSFGAEMATKALQGLNTSK